jgi:hypothetical protein
MGFHQAIRKRSDRETIRVLCYSPYNLWTLHGLWEMTILHALKFRRADVKYVLCDGLYTDCDVHWASTAPRTPFACTQCQAHSAQLANQLLMPFEWLGRYLLPADLREAKRWAASIPSDDLVRAGYGEWRVGKWVKSSVHSHLRDSVLDLHSPDVERAFRSYLYSGLIACMGLSRLIDDYQPDRLLVFNGRMSSTRVAMELANNRSIPLICHERGTRDESLRLFQNDNAHSIEYTKRMWRDWGLIPLSPRELEEADEYLSSRAEGKDTGWKSFNPPRQELDTVRSRLDLEKNRPIWGLFPSSEDELIASEGWESCFEGQLQWIDRTLDFVALHPEVDLVIRAHPNIGGSRATGTNQGQMEKLLALRKRLPQNARLVMPEDDINSYSLMDLATVGLVYQSTVAWEMACKGKIVVIAAQSLCSGLPFVRTANDPTHYEEILRSLTSIPVGHVDPGVRRLAYRFSYGLNFRYNIRFPLVKMSDPHTGVLAYTSLDELEWGKDPNLDRVVRIILDGELVCPPPSSAEQARSDADERRFFGSEQVFP